MTLIKPPQKARNRLLANNTKRRLEMQESAVHLTTAYFEEDRAKDMPEFHQF